MGSGPIVSIVLPTYNGGQGLDEAVGSCIAQTLREWELIIVDDASTDDTAVRIGRHVAEDARIRAVRHSMNKKLPAALNTGFAEAKGQFLTWTSDDNLYRPTALAEMLTFLQSNPDLDLVYADCTLIDEQGLPIRSFPAAPPDELVLGNSVGPCFLYRRRVYEVLGGYAEDLFLAEDYDYWLRASVSFRLAQLHKDLYCYRLHDSSLTETQAEGVRLATVRVLRRNLPAMRWMSSELRSRAWSNLSQLESADWTKKLSQPERRRMWAWWTLKAKDVSSARKHAFKALRLAPLSLESWRVLACAIRGH